MTLRPTESCHLKLDTICALKCCTALKFKDYFHFMQVCDVACGTWHMMALTTSE